MNRITCLLDYLQANRETPMNTAQIWAGISLERMNGNDEPVLPRSRDELDCQLKSLVSVGRIAEQSGRWVLLESPRPLRSSQGKMF